MRKEYHNIPTFDGEYSLTEMFYSYDLMFYEYDVLLFPALLVLI